MSEAENRDGLALVASQLEATIEAVVADLEKSPGRMQILRRPRGRKGFKPAGEGVRTHLLPHMDARDGVEWLLDTDRYSTQLSKLEEALAGSEGAQKALLGTYDLWYHLALMNAKSAAYFLAVLGISNRFYNKTTKEAASKAIEYALKAAARETQSYTEIILVEGTRLDSDSPVRVGEWELVPLTEKDPNETLLTLVRKRGGYDTELTSAFYLRRNFSQPVRKNPAPPAEPVNRFVVPTYEIDPQDLTSAIHTFVSGTFSLSPVQLIIPEEPSLAYGPIAISKGHSESLSGGLQISDDSPAALVARAKAIAQARKAGGLRARLIVSRFSAGCDANDPLDQVVDIATSLESLLLTGEKEELRHRFAVRSALAAKATPEERKKAFRLAQDIYDWRSNIVHGTPPDDKFTLRKDQGTGSELIGAERAARVVEDFAREVLEGLWPSLFEKAVKDGEEFWNGRVFASTLLEAPQVAPAPSGGAGAPQAQSRSPSAPAGNDSAGGNQPD